MGDRLSPAPIKDRQAVDGGDQRLRETVGDCEPDRLERERELLALLSQVVLWACVSKDAIGLNTKRTEASQPRRERLRALPAPCAPAAPSRASWIAT